MITQFLLLTHFDHCSAVFSYWRSTLDAIEQALGHAGIMFTRYDGRMTKIQRDSSLFTFAQNTGVKVILVSITCGGLGYVAPSLLNHIKLTGLF
jgi:SNF2 family DNA or RNA helicase